MKKKTRSILTTKDFKTIEKILEEKLTKHATVSIKYEDLKMRPLKPIQWNQ